MATCDVPGVGRRGLRERTRERDAWPTALGQRSIAGGKAGGLLHEYACGCASGSQTATVFPNWCFQIINGALEVTSRALGSSRTSPA